MFGSLKRHRTGWKHRKTVLTLKRPGRVLRERDAPVHTSPPQANFFQKGASQCIRKLNQLFRPISFKQQRMVFVM